MTTTPVKIYITHFIKINISLSKSAYNKHKFEKNWFRGKINNIYNIFGVLYN